MPSFDYKGFFESNGIDYITSGPNVKMGEINISCPFCADDPSKHLGVDLKRGLWACWRSKGHAGKKPHRLVRALLDCSWDRVNVICDGTVMHGSTDVASMKDRLATLDGPKLKDEFEPLVKPPQTFRLLRGMGPAFIRYLYNRGFQDDAQDVATAYDLRGALSGIFRYRLLLPIHDDEQVVGWTGRDITGKSDIRYYTLPSGNGIKNFIFNERACRDGGRVLYITEGPLDALKVDYYAGPLNAHAIALMGLRWTPQQIERVRNVGTRFDQVRVLFDASAYGRSIDFVGYLYGLNAGISSLPPGVDDPGDLTARSVADLVRSDLRDFLPKSVS